MDSDRGFWTAFSVVGTVAALIISVIALVAATDDSDDAPSQPAEVTTTTGATKQKKSPPEPAAAGATVEATLSEFEVALSPAEVEAGPVTLDTTNEGEGVHNLVLEGTDLKQPDLPAGESGRLDLGELEAGDYVLFCDLPGHRPAGMEATLTVTGG